MGDATMRSAGSAEPRQAAGGSQGGVVPTRWWHWVLLYPAAAGALLTAVPDWIDSIQAFRNGITNRSNMEAEQQLSLWRRNASCLSLPFGWYNNPGNVRVNATTCPSGDVLVRVSTPGPDSRTLLEWVDLGSILGESGGSLIPQARAASSRGVAQIGRASQPSQARSLSAGQPGATATPICHRYGQRQLLRRISTRQGCFDEVIDMMNGVVVRRTRVSCRGGC